MITYGCSRGTSEYLKALVLVKGWYTRGKVWLCLLSWGTNHLDNKKTWTIR